MGSLGGWWWWAGDPHSAVTAAPSPTWPPSHTLLRCSRCCSRRESRAGRIPNPTRSARRRRPMSPLGPLVPRTCQIAQRPARTRGHDRPARPLTPQVVAYQITPVMPGGHSQGGVPGHARATNAGIPPDREANQSSRAAGQLPRPPPFPRLPSWLCGFDPRHPLHCLLAWSGAPSDVRPTERPTAFRALVPSTCQMRHPGRGPWASSQPPTAGGRCPPRWPCSHLCWRAYR
jgi:hypothetical protein